MTANKHIDHEPLIAQLIKSNCWKHQHIGKQLAQCDSPTYWISQHDGQLKRGIKSCNLILCSRCQRKKQNRRLKEFERTIYTLAHQGYRFLLLTVGFKGVPVDQSRAFLTKTINKGLNTLARPSTSSPHDGLFPSREFHLYVVEAVVRFDVHVVIAAKPEDADTLLEQVDWPARVKEMFDLHYTPHPEAAKIKEIAPHALGLPNLLAQNVLRVMSYITNPWNFTSNPSAGIELSEQLDAMKRVTPSGVFRTVKRQLNGGRKKRKQKES